VHDAQTQRLTHHQLNMHLPCLPLLLLSSGCLQQQELRAFHEKLQAALDKSRSRLAFSDLACDGFALRHSLKITAASDVVHAVTALLTEHTLAEVAGDRQSSSAFW
jgi:hypothetical protein